MQAETRPVVHIVLFKWKADADPQSIREAIDALNALKERVPGIQDIRAGENFSDRAHGYQCGLVVLFPNRAALEAYQPHPAHQEFVNNFARPLAEDVLALDFEL